MIEETEARLGEGNRKEEVGNGKQRQKWGKWEEGKETREEKVAARERWEQTEYNNLKKTAG